MKCATPACRAPGTSVSPSAARVSASWALSRRNGTPCARAAPGVIITRAPPTVKASTPIPAPLRKTRRSMASMGVLLAVEGATCCRRRAELQVNAKEGLESSGGRKLISWDRCAKSARMMTILDHAIAKVRTLSDADQDTLGAVMLSLAEEWT